MQSTVYQNDLRVQLLYKIFKNFSLIFSKIFKVFKNVLKFKKF